MQDVDLNAGVRPFEIGASERTIMINRLSTACETTNNSVPTTELPRRRPKSELIEFSSGGASDGAGVQPGRARYRVPVWTIRQWAFRGKVASAKLKTHLIMPTSELNRIIAENLRPALEDPQSAPALPEERLADAQR